LTIINPDDNRLRIGRFPKEHRLRNAAEFKAVYVEGHRVASKSFVAFILPNASTSRFGLTTPRRLGGACERNRIRRRIREILRQNRCKLPGGVDVVLNPRRSVLWRNLESLRDELVSLLKAP